MQANKGLRCCTMTKIEKFDKVKTISMLSDIWEVLDNAEREMLVAQSSVGRFKKGEPIYREGDNPDNLLCLLTGKVKIFRNGVGGRSLINRVLRPVQYFGYRASMAGETYVTAASAFEESTIVFVPMRTIFQLMEHNTRLCHFFIHALAVDLGKADQRIVSITQKHVRGRMAETLLDLLDIYGFDSDGKTLDLHITREDMANLSNMTTSNAIRTLSTFAEEGLIEVNGRYIKLNDVAALQRISDIG